MWELTAVTVLALGGVAVASARLARDRRPIRWYVRGGMVLLALGAAWTQVPGLLGTVDVRHSQTAERAGNSSLALSYANNAISAEPWSASAYAQRGLIYESAGNLNKAAADLRQAIDHQSTDFSLWLLMSRVETERGQLDAAVRDYNRAHQLRPKAAVFYYAPYFATHFATH